jgi:Fe-S-cluster containining protein
MFHRTSPRVNDEEKGWPLTMSDRERDRFYKNGLQFECLKCGNCCTGAPGFVYLSEEDIVSIAGFLRKDKGSFIREYTRAVTIFGERRFSLTERQNYDCVFWNRLCLIYEVRPYQCRSFPFWKRHLVSEREWNRVGDRCRGINRGPVHPAEEIDHLVSGTPVYDIGRFSMISDPDILTTK